MSHKNMNQPSPFVESPIEKYKRTHPDCKEIPAWVLKEQFEIDECRQMQNPGMGFSFASPVFYHG